MTKSVSKADEALAAEEALCDGVHQAVLDDVARVAREALARGRAMTVEALAAEEALCDGVRQAVLDDVARVAREALARGRAMTVEARARCFEDRLVMLANSAEWHQRRGEQLHSEPT